MQDKCGDPGSSVVTDGGDGWVSSMAEREMHRRMQRCTESWGAVVVDKSPDSPAERELGRVHAVAQSDGMTATSQAVAERWMHQRVQRRTESWGAVVVDKPPDSPAERSSPLGEFELSRVGCKPWRRVME